MTWPPNATRAEILRILEINRNLYTEWVITRAETEAVLALLHEAERLYDCGRCGIVIKPNTLVRTSITCPDCGAPAALRALFEGEAEPREEGRAMPEPGPELGGTRQVPHGIRVWGESDAGGAPSKSAFDAIAACEAAHFSTDGLCAECVDAHTETALVADRLARHDEAVAAIEAAVKGKDMRISALEARAEMAEAALKEATDDEALCQRFLDEDWLPPHQTADLTARLAAAEGTIDDINRLDGETMAGMQTEINTLRTRLAAEEGQLESYQNALKGVETTIGPERWQAAHDRVFPDNHGWGMVFDEAWGDLKEDLDAAEAKALPAHPLPDGVVFGVTCGCGRVPVHSTVDPDFHRPPEPPR